MRHTRSKLSCRPRGNDTRRSLSTGTPPREHRPKIGPGGQESRPGAQGKRPKPSKTNRNSGTLPRPAQRSKIFYFKQFSRNRRFWGSKSAQPILISLGKGRGRRPRPCPRLIRMGCADYDPTKSTTSGKLLKIRNFGPLGEGICIKEP